MAAPLAQMNSSETLITAISHTFNMYNILVRLRLITFDTTLFLRKGALQNK